MTPHTIIPGTYADHTGLWVGSLKPTPNHSPRDDPAIAARLDGIDPPTGYSLRDVLLSMGCTGKAQILRW